MPPSQRITIRVPADLLTALENHVRPGEALSDIVRRALQDYVRRLSDRDDALASDTTSDTASLPAMLPVLTQMARQLEALSDAVRHLAAGQAPPPDPLVVQIRAWQAEGMPLRAIAAKLNADGVPTRSGRGRWYQSNLSRLLKRTAPR